MVLICIGTLVMVVLLYVKVNDAMETINEIKEKIK